MKEIFMLRARWRELETEPRTRLNGHEGGQPRIQPSQVLMGHRASSRPYDRVNRDQVKINWTFDRKAARKKICLQKELF